MVAQAAHMPVHLGSMPASVTAVLDNLSLLPGDIALLNDPYLGGTHLPDLTMVAAVYQDSQLIGYVANRAHHADIGGSSPGSMPLATELYQEGLIIPPVKLADRGRTDDKVVMLLCRNVRTPDERRGDLEAQMACVAIGQERLLGIVHKYGLDLVHEYMDRLLAYSEALTREAIQGMPDGSYTFEDYLDDDGLSREPLKIRVRVAIEGDRFTADFEGTAAASDGPVNAVMAVVESAVLYVIRCIVGESVPANHGCRVPLTVKVPFNSVLNASPPHAVSAGNVETSQRIVDVLLGAMAQALPTLIPAASQGTMNNVAFGGYDSSRRRPFAYYETIAGGMGARPQSSGISGIQTHMTNTLNTPVEALEFEMPLRVKEYSIRHGSGGSGKFRGGDGLRRRIEFLAATDLTVISDRRQMSPYGLSGGNPGVSGRNHLAKAGSEGDIDLASKVRIALQPGDIITIETPGGGGWGTP